MTERLPPDRVRKVARLARLALDDDEVRRFAGQLGEVLDYVELLGAVETGAPAPAAEPAGPAREDVASLPGDPAPLLRNAPATADGAFFVVPRVVESDEE
jgi:aspartyl-tRNA(Asn)/glutamyl-tRNA(Gln) amidotransferase subunit C